MKQEQDEIRFSHVFVLVNLCRFGEAVLCDALEGRSFECGNRAALEADCPKTCCFNQTASPPCYFKEKDFGPIQHANGLCINVQDGSDRLIWSRDCTSKNVFFLVARHHPVYHAATGKCILPIDCNGKKCDVILQPNNRCTASNSKFQPTVNGNLEYDDYSGRKMCIGSSSVANNKWEPQENENVTIAENICSVNNSCKFDYGHGYLCFPERGRL
ncbi:uncharacterized protein LOC124452143 [Xenia sp. Carnegie-2017]|uniref:uncharacterized protein LOC124452143 n=1 Tax=Xenia sp. Carnegie-2017 TaxID=2897299 RepID=UPI001F03868E|nr:uncharacterized protein LOC124452143 [Xenia sp. Carnegie-2017]